MAVNGTKLAKNFRKAALKPKSAALNSFASHVSASEKALHSHADDVLRSSMKEIDEGMGWSPFINEVKEEAEEYLGESILFGGTALSSMLFPDDATFKERVGRTAAAVGVAGAGIGAYALHKGAKAAKMGYGGYAKLQGNKAINKIKGFLK